MVDRLEFTYTLKASEDWLKEHVNDGSDTVIYNEAQIMDNTIKRWSADEDVLYFTNRLTKTAVQDGTSNLIRFTLEINTLGANLNPTEDYLIVTDESTGIQIKKDSIEVFKVSAKGEESKLNKLGATTVDADMTSEQWGLLSAESENQYKLKVPDKVHLRIKYEALITEMGDVKISNKASIDGVERAEDSYEKILKVDEIFAGGSGGTYQMEIEKVDSKHTDKKLANAKFKLYIVGEESSDLTETKQITVGSTEYTCHSEKESEFITDEDGRCIITKWFLIPGSYYILEEITPPDGYQSLEPILFYFGLKDAETDPDVEIVPPDGTLIIADPPIEYNLPETGGPGTLFYIVTGLALVLGSRILLMVRRRLRQAR